MADRVFERLVSNYERGGVGAEKYTLRVGPRMGSETVGWRVEMYVWRVPVLRIHPENHASVG
jgi:hypothetical protein